MIESKLDKPVTPQFPPGRCDLVTQTVRIALEDGKPVQRTRYWWWREGLLQAVSPDLGIGN